MEELVFSVSDFVAVFNQTINYAYPNVSIEGELDSFRISKQKWVYFNLKDESSSLQFFGNVYQLPGPLEDGLTLRVRGVPTLHHKYGFSINIVSIQPTGEGSLKRAAQLLEAKLRTEGLFEPARKRQITYPANKIGLITSSEAAAYHDFMKVLNARWGGVEIFFYDVQVQGELAPEQIIRGLEYFNTHDLGLDAVVLTRGGGSGEDLQAFSTEAVARAVAASRIPTIAAIGHEIDISLAELAADKRAATPSQAAEIITPDRRQTVAQLVALKDQLFKDLTDHINNLRASLEAFRVELSEQWQRYFDNLKLMLEKNLQLLGLLDPVNAVKRGYAIVRKNGHIVSDTKLLKPSDIIDIQIKDATLDATINDIRLA
jgi:exodeoxyribonuclease VII large subunit